VDGITVKDSRRSCVAIPRLLLESTTDACRLAGLKHHRMA